MTDVTIDDVASQLASIIKAKSKPDQKPARIGRVNTSGQWYLVPPASGRTGFFVVTVIEGNSPSTIYEARYKNRHALIAGMPITIQRDNEGEWEMIDTDGRQADSFTTAYGGVGFTPDFAKQPISPRRFLVGLGNIFSTSGMSVYVNPFHYDNGTTQLYYAGGTIDLTTNVPSAGNCRMVKVSVDPATNNLVATNGITFASAMFSMLGDIQLAAISHTGFIPIVGVRLIAGQTTLTTDNDFFDCRRFVSNVSSPVLSVVGSAPITVTPAAGVYTVSHATSGVIASTYPKVTVNTTGHVTAGASLVDTDIPNLDTSKITSGVFNNARVNFAAPSAIGSTTPAAGTFTTITGSDILAIDTNVLYVDVTNNRVGINTSTPSQALEVTAASGGTQMRIVSASGARGALTVDTGSTGQQSVFIWSGNSTEYYQAGKNNDAQESFFFFDSISSRTIWDYYPTSAALRLMPSSGDIEIGNIGGKNGFFGSSGTTKPTITGSRGGNAALASLLTALANLGMLTDSTTA